MEKPFQPRDYLARISSIETRFRTVREGLDSDSIHLLSVAELSDNLIILYGLQTELRRIRHQLRKELADRHDSLVRGTVDRDTLGSWQKDASRAKFILNDSDALMKKIMAVVRRGQRAAGIPIYLYALSHPLTGEVKYIGKTSDPESRLKEHLANPTNADMASWFELLALDGLMPEMEIIDLATDENWQQKEARQIWRYRQMGYDLLNREGPSE